MNKFKMQNEKCKISEKKDKVDIKLRAYRFALCVVKMVDTLSSSRVNGILSDQLLRSATSIGANIIEAQAASSKKDFRNFLNHSLKSANETKFWLALLRDSEKAPAATIEPLLLEAKELANILGASIITLKKG